jgi:hypothetical protein
MHFSLIPHPDTPCPEVAGISVSMARDGDLIALDWQIEGDIGALAIPAPASPARTDGLWQHLCVELFVGDAAGPGYTEFNFAPSGAWAAYRFDDYRTGMRELEMTNGPAIAVVESANTLAASVSLNLEILAERDIGLSAVIETRDGAKRYWALAHPPGKPDFHHADCFIRKLAARKRP